MSYDLILKIAAGHGERDVDAVLKDATSAEYLSTCEITPLEDSSDPDAEDLAEALEERSVSRLDFVWFCLRRGRIPSTSSDPLARAFLNHKWGRDLVAVHLSSDHDRDRALGELIPIARRHGLAVHDPQLGRDVGP